MHKTCWLQGKSTVEFAYVQFTDWIREKLYRTGQKQTDVAEQMGVGDTEVSRWQNGKTRPSFENVLRLADFFEVDPVEIFEMLERPDWANLFKRFAEPGPPSPRPQASFFDICGNRKQAEIHRRLQVALEDEGNRHKDVIRQLVDIAYDESGGDSGGGEAQPSKKALAS